MPTSVKKIFPYILTACVASLITATLLIVGSASAASSNYSGRSMGPYMIMQHSNPTAAAGVFRVNVNTGTISYCYIDAGSKGVNCTGEAQ